MNDLLLIPVIFLAVGGILILLWRLFLIASGLFLIGFVSFLIFVEVYGIYLFFTERHHRYCIFCLLTFFPSKNAGGLAFLPRI